MPSSSRSYEIFAGTPTSEAVEITFHGLGAAGTPNAKRRLVHPNPLLVPIVYFNNPDRTLGFDKVPLYGPPARAVRTLTSTKVLRHQGYLEDAVITEIWIGTANKFSMPAHVFRELIEYWKNPPPFSATAQTYIQWHPLDIGDEVYNIEILTPSCGGSPGDPTRRFDVREFRPPGGDGDVAGPLDIEDEAFLSAGLLYGTVTFPFKIVSEV